MAAKMAGTSVLAPAATLVNTHRQTQKKVNPKVACIREFNSCSSLKPQNKILSLGLPVCTKQRFAAVFYLQCVGEILRIAAVMNGLVLVGVAIGFVLLRIEASLEEAE